MHSADLVAISNYQTFRKRQEGDCDSTPAIYCRTGYEADTKQLSQEVRLRGTQRGLHWDVGVYYLDLKTSGIQKLFGPIAQDFFGTQYSYTAFEPDTKSWAAFGQVAYEVLPSVTITGGLRYTDDSKNMYQSFLNGVVPGGVVYDQNTIGDLAKRTDTSVSFLGNVSWRPADDIAIYSGVSRAPKSGTVNSGFGPPPTAQYVVRPERRRIMREASRAGGLAAGYRSTRQRSIINIRTTRPSSLRVWPSACSMSMRRSKVRSLRSKRGPTHTWSCRSGWHI
jgi:iron complex outermembrane receptor protein